MNIAPSVSSIQKTKYPKWNFIFKTGFNIVDSIKQFIAVFRLCRFVYSEMILLVDTKIGAMFAHIHFVASM